MSRCQVKYNTLFRDAFATIRVDVQRTFPPPPVEALATRREYLTSVLRSYAVWNCDVRYTYGFSDVAVVLMAILVPEIGKLITLEASEVLVFWCFAAFVERTASGLLAEDLMVMQAREIEEIMHITERFHPSCGQWLRERNMGDLSFFASALILVLERTFTSVIIPERVHAIDTSVFRQDFDPCLVLGPGPRSFAFEPSIDIHVRRTPPGTVATAVHLPSPIRS
jgi:hypothetical protein